MTTKKFNDFWEMYSQDWYQGSIVPFGGTNSVEIKELCKIKSDCAKDLHGNYTRIKKIIKDCYFKNPKDKLLSRYKRAAVIAYVILLSNPLEFYDSTRYDLDPDFLKQRLAFHIAIASIVIDYPEDSVRQEIRDKGKLFNFDIIDKKCAPFGDSFLMSVYKDMYYSEIYHNYNILTMANVLGLLTELGSNLKNIDPINKPKEY